MKIKVKSPALMASVTAPTYPVSQDTLMIVLETETVVLKAGLVMVMQTVKIRPMAVISPAMIMTVVTAEAEMRFLYVIKLVRCIPAG